MQQKEGRREAAKKRVGMRRTVPAPVTGKVTPLALVIFRRSGTVSQAKLVGP